MSPQVRQQWDIDGSTGEEKAAHQTLADRRLVCRRPRFGHRRSGELGGHTNETLKLAAGTAYKMYASPVCKHSIHGACLSPFLFAQLTIVDDKLHIACELSANRVCNHK